MLKTFLLSAFLLLPATVQAQDVHTDFDKGANFTQYRTYAWHSGKGMKQNQLLDNTLFRDRLRASVEEELAKKGLRSAQSNPDLYVTYFVSSKERQEYNSFPYTLGSWYQPYWNDVMITHYTEGTLVLDLVDAHTNKLVWRSYATKSVDNPTDLAKNKTIDKIVEKSLKKFPPKES